VGRQSELLEVVGEKVEVRWWEETLGWVGKEEAEEEGWEQQGQGRRGLERRAELGSRVL
jgi:hypothetical protein